MVLGKLPVPGRPTMWMVVEQRPIALGACADEGSLNRFTLLSFLSCCSLSLGEGPI